ncbi:MAG: sulfatase [Cyclobacteriaceae bacterium]|nr:sulfatase [Cyclobacteriaceae bacterium]
MKNNQFFICLLLLPALIFLTCCAAYNDDVPEKPNIVFIMSDDHAYQAISAYSDHLIKTPNIDRLANEGILFKNAFVTNSICAPSRAVLLTGKHSYANGVFDNALPFDGAQDTFIKRLGEAGYETAVIGKWHLKSRPAGFSHYQILRDQGEYYNPFFITEEDTVQMKGYVTDLTTDIALSWLRMRVGEKPFCLLLHHKAPHRNWMPNLQHLALFNDRDLPVPDNYFDDYISRSAAAREQEMEIAADMTDAWDLKIRPDDPDPENWDERGYAWHYGKLMTGEQKKVWDAHYDPLNESYLKAEMTDKERALWKYQRYIKDYLRCIVSVDDNVGRVLDELDVLGLSENTLVVYTSDQGFYLGEHGWFDKRFMYEESLRTPLLMRFPGRIEPGMVNENLVQNLDFAATFIDITGVDEGYGHGSSLMPLFNDSKVKDWREYVYYHYYEYPGAHSVKRHYGLRTDRYKLIHFYNDIDAWEFYDLEEDPGEMKNSIGSPRYRVIIDSLQQLLENDKFYQEDTFQF